MATEARLKWLEHQLKRRNVKTPVCLVFTDGVIVNGETLTLADYHACYDGTPRLETTVQGVGLSDLDRSSPV